MHGGKRHVIVAAAVSNRSPRRMLLGPASRHSKPHLDIAGRLAHNARQAANVAWRIINDKAQCTIGHQLAQPLGGRLTLRFSL
jgi:hypothetical protein